MEIDYFWARDSIWGPMDKTEDYDVPASELKYAELVYKAIKNTYPGAKISMSYPTPGLQDGCSVLDDDCNTYSIEQAILYIANNIWQEGSWRVNV